MGLKGDGMTSPIDIGKIAETNPAVDAEKLQRLREIQELLEKAGVARKADYRLASPLGGTPQRPALPTNGSIRMT